MEDGKKNVGETIGEEEGRIEMLHSSLGGGTF